MTGQRRTDLDQYNQAAQAFSNREAELATLLAAPAPGTVWQAAERQARIEYVAGWLRTSEPILAEWRKELGL